MPAHAEGLRVAASRPDFIAAVAAMLGVLVFDTLPGLFIAIAISLLLSHVHPSVQAAVDAASDGR